MTNFDSNPRYSNAVPPTSRSSGSWIAAAVVAVIVLIALGYMFQDRWMGSSAVVEHRAAATDVPSPVASPMSPAARSAEPAPAATPKP